MSTRTISAKELHDRVQSGEAVELIDVRTPVEFQEVHATVAQRTARKSGLWTAAVWPAGKQDIVRDLSFRQSGPSGLREDFGGGVSGSGEC